MALSDQEAVAATLRDRDMFRVLVDRYQLPLLRYAKRLGADADTAQDILQEALINAYARLNDYDPSLSFSAWMYRIVHNETVDHFRRQKSRPQAADSEADMRSLEAMTDGVDIEASADANIRSRAIGEALGNVRLQYRDVLILRFFEEKSYEEIADILRLPRGTVATYLTRGKAELAKILKAHPSTDIYYADYD